ncbi:flagellar protein FlgN [Idiomarina seosinensis]|uniref:flagellar export chaperone FlgN n=1 Tax=Idiomarina seosinensis TaxID=281739 RepID=UPI00384C4547
MTAAALTDHLQQLADSLDALAACQQQELKAIVDRQHRRVAELAEQKAELLTQVSEADNALRQHPDSEQLQQDPELAEQVAIIKQQLEAVKQQSAVNERVVHSTLNSIEQLKQTIISNVKKDSMTYNAKGKMR